ncbi:MAG: hypothetical protein JWQ90_2557 [Hydrocarboniphaga sp.]|uniref:hypothetical protein n=1 Tax=Hydrocarboniphaga sp. TaxID=2033016 RepID=UPI0026154CF8|nr:hypothetical protein [Hydrocarboniphaga sp.]MDB5970107.1 hypothetical protein [Hydrocarboniphaga sp.]
MNQYSKKFLKYSGVGALMLAAGQAMADSGAISAAAVTAAGDTAGDVSTVAVAIVAVVALIAAASFIFSMLRN